MGGSKRLQKRHRSHTHNACGSKTDITVTAACPREGERLRLWILAKGKTEKCEKRFRENPKLRHAFSSGKLVIYHAKVDGQLRSKERKDIPRPLGFSRFTFAQFLRHLAPVVVERGLNNVCLVFDNCRIHSRPEIEALCAEQGGNIDFYPHTRQC